MCGPVKFGCCMIMCELVSVCALRVENTWNRVSECVCVCRIYDTEEIRTYTIDSHTHRNYLALHTIHTL